MTPGNDRGRPAQAAPESNSISASTAPVYATASAYVVLVVSDDDKCRRRPYLSLHSAVAAIQRAEAKGHTAEMILCRLVPTQTELKWSE